MSLWPAPDAGTQTGAPQRMKMPPIPQSWGEQHTPRIGAGRAITQRPATISHGNICKIALRRLTACNLRRQVLQL